MSKKEEQKTENGFSLEIRKNVEEATARKPMSKHSKYEKYLNQILAINSSEYPLEIAIPSGITGASLTAYMQIFFSFTSAIYSYFSISILFISLIFKLIFSPIFILEQNSFLSR